MSTDMILRIESTSSDVTEQFAAEVGDRLRGGEVIVLASDLGGGKTTFVRGLAKGMGSTDHVSSPTFTVSKEYRAPELTLYHFDFYRLEEPGVIAAELEESLEDPKAVIAIEWANIVDEVLPADKFIVRLLHIGETKRIIEISCPLSLAYLVQENQK